MARNNFGIGGFAARLVLAAILVFGSFNPTGYSFYHWVTQGPSDQTAFMVLVGIILVIAFTIFVRATWRSIGVIGVILCLALLGSMVWVFVQQQWLDLENNQVMLWIGLTIVSIILAVGMSWSHVRRRLSGQYDMDDVDD